MPQLKPIIPTSQAVLNPDIQGFRTERNYFTKEDRNFSFFLTNLANQDVAKDSSGALPAEEHKSRVTFKNNIDHTMSLSQMTFLNSTRPGSFMSLSHSCISLFEEKLRKEKLNKILADPTKYKSEFSYLISVIKKTHERSLPFLPKCC